MKLKLLAVILLLTVATSFAGTFNSTPGRFSADFVVTPTVDTKTIKTGKTSLTITTFFAKSADNTLGENIDYTDFPETLTTEQLIETAKAAFDGITLDGLGKTESRGRNWILAAGHDDELLYFYAVTCVNKRLYEVTIAEPIKGATKDGEMTAEAF